MKNFIFLVFFGFLVWLYFYLSIANYSPTYLSPTLQILTIPDKKIAPDPEFFEIIQNINAQNDKIQSFYCNEVTIKMRGFKVTGFLSFEKNKRFRFIIDSFFSKELDIGSNDSYFWIWSKESGVLRYVQHDQITHSKLKTPLNPEWLIEGTNLNGINIENATITKNKENYHIVQTRTSHNNETTKCLTIIQKNLVKGHFLYNSKNIMIASSEILAFQKSGEFTLPKVILVTWPEEKIQLEWTLLRPKINIDIPKNNWVMPNYRNSVNMAK